MSELKPLTKERRAEIEAFVAEGFPLLDGATEAAAYLRDLLAAEAYWRSIVKGIQPIIPIGIFDGRVKCMFCSWNEVDRPFRVTHDADCAWKRAQEGE